MIVCKLETVFGVWPRKNTVLKSVDVSIGTSRTIRTRSHHNGCICVCDWTLDFVELPCLCRP